ncbi:hypothetical protein [Actinacidiphila rubida]|uniref:Uncharacterized protein n=1 Tax=Actinacidiphila rubida TaxID=310780 RepID=A0A1H8S089_9ACTN|nr:hypothetical protein [Actinacidiphila rubida]SEO71864.1 hypothetical protein SAMN05216267_103827 [Actinacidiphila rubida]
MNHAHDAVAAHDTEGAHDSHDVRDTRGPAGAHGVPLRVLIVGRSPGVLVEAVGLLRARGHRADATNQFGSVLEDYDVGDLDVLVFGGMVPPDTKQHLRDAVAERNPDVTFLQGLAGIAGVIAAQVDAVTSADATDDITYDGAGRTVRVVLPAAAHVTVEAFWGTSFTPPEPRSTSARVRDGELGAGVHTIAVPEYVPPVASFAAVTVGATVRVFTIGGMPGSVTRLVPTSAGDQRLPEVARVTTQSHER